MFERYTEKATRVIFFARYALSELGSAAIEPEHLLLGLFREDSALISRFLSPAGVSIDSLRTQIEEHTMAGKNVPFTVDVPFSSRSKNVLTFASEEAKQLSHNHIGTGHLLLGLLREENSLAAMVLAESGIKYPVVRKQLENDAER